MLYVLQIRACDPHIAQPADSDFYWKDIYSRWYPITDSTRAAAVLREYRNQYPSEQFRLDTRSDGINGAV